MHNFWCWYEVFVHFDIKKKDILILGEGPTQGLDFTTLTAENKYSINFTENNKKFCLSLHCYGANSYLQKLLTLSRYFSHVTKSRILKNLNLRKKADCNFRRTFLKNCFRHLKLDSNPPSWLARCRCHMGTFWKTKEWGSYFWEGRPFKFWYMEFPCQRRLNSTKTGISSWF